MDNFIFRAIRGEALSPQERALLTAIKNVLVGAIGTAVVALVTAIMSGQQLSLALILGACMTGFYAIIQAARKYFSAQGDHDLSALLEAAEQVAHGRIDTRYPPLPSGTETKENV